MGFSIKKVLERLLHAERSPARLAASCCLGIFIATSPFIGLMTWIAIPLSWIFGLNTVVVITILYIVNNPLTMVPIMVANYAVGYFIIERLLGINLMPYNPSWMEWVNHKIGPTMQKCLGITDICFWCYILGGLIFALICTAPLYIPLKRWFAYLISKNIAH